MAKGKGSAMWKENVGSSPKHFSDPHKAGGSVKPATGKPAVCFEGTFAHSAAGQGVTHPAKGNAGSHDHLIREHGGHEGGSKSAKHS